MKKLTSLLLFLALYPPLQAEDFKVSFIRLAKKVNPAVVNIRTTQLPKKPTYQDPFDQMLREYYGVPRERMQNPGHALGTGFIIEESGLIITNNHVIDKADEIEVQLSDNDKKLYEAKLIGRDPTTDLALIKIKTKFKLPIIKMGNSNETQVGEWVAAFGNPLGLGHTITKGIISAKAREVNEIGIYPFLQTDASINPGNSGGPLVNLKGEVIGVNTFIIKGAQGLGFAIPINVVKKLLPELKTTGKVERGFIGVTIAPVNEYIAKELGLKKASGLMVTEVTKNSPAYEAGIREYDVINKVGTKDINHPKILQNEIAKLKIGEKIKIEVTRNSKKKILTLVLKAKPKKNLTVMEGKLRAPYKLGFELSNLSPELAKQLRIPYGRYPIIYTLDQGSPADRAGLQVGDVILDINKKTVRSAKEAVRAFRKEGNLIRVRRGPYIMVLFIRD